MVSAKGNVGLLPDYSLNHHLEPDSLIVPLLLSIPVFAAAVSFPPTSIEVSPKLT